MPPTLNYIGLIDELDPSSDSVDSRIKVTTPKMFEVRRSSSNYPGLFETRLGWEVNSRERAKRMRSGEAH